MKQFFGGIWRHIKMFFKLWWKWLIAIVFNGCTILAFDYLRWHSDLVKRLFFDSNGNFQWLGISSVIAVITLIFTSINNKRSMTAEVVSKSRIQWISDLRPKTSRYLAISSQLETQISLTSADVIARKMATPNDVVLPDEVQQARIQDLYSEIKELHELLCASFAENTENYHIRKYIDNVYDGCKNSMSQLTGLEAKAKHKLKQPRVITKRNGRKVKRSWGTVQRNQISSLAAAAHKSRASLRKTATVYYNRVWHQATNPYRYL